ncbi:MAG: DNRLRE domain-containing protein [Chthoniobacteraceae bacterium]
MNTFRLLPLLLLASFAHADVLPPVQDTSAAKTKLTIASGKAATLIVNGTSKGFVMFNLNSLPVGVQAADIANARLRVYFPTVKVAGNIDIYTVTAAWNETSIGTEPSISGAPVATLPTASVVAKNFAEVDVSTTVQAWRTTPASNLGFAFVTSGLTSATIGAKEGSGSGYPCELEVEVDRATTSVALALPFLHTTASQNGPSFLSANVVAGSTANIIAPGVTGVVIAGGGATNGFPQSINANYAAIGGGYSNTIAVNGSQSVIAGGAGNTASASGVTIGGGQSNTGSGSFATGGGGQGNVASGANSTVPGGISNTASGTSSFAAGNRAKAANTGSFVWGDSTAADISSTANDQFTIRANGGVALTVNATNAVSVPVGTLYKDNTLVAWGRVASNALADGFNVASVVRNSAGNYTVILNTSFTGTALVPVVSVSYSGAQPTTAAAVRIASTNQLLSNTSFNVFVNSGTFAAADADFTFIVTGR